jgi:DNA-binding response OmpR family regulator
MKNAKIFLVEDDPDVVKSLKRFLDMRGHSVVVEAVNRESALLIINSGQLEKMEVNVAIIDGHFPDCERGLYNFNGPVVAKAIKDAGCVVTTIAVSGDDQSRITYGDLNFAKGKGAGPMVDAIDSL